MFKTKKFWACLMVLVIAIAGLSVYLIAEEGDVPAKLQVALFVKILGFHKGLTGNVNIYVLGSPEVAKEFQAVVGQSIGTGKIVKVTEGADLPTEKPEILYLGNASKIAAVTSYTQKNKVLSITGIGDLVAKGITLGIAKSEDNKPKILLNLSSSKEEGVDWNPAILKVAAQIK